MPAAGNVLPVINLQRVVRRECGAKIAINMKQMITHQAGHRRLVADQAMQGIAEKAARRPFDQRSVRAMILGRVQ